ncbi:hypothetical protein [Phormidesmis priestleyi]
MLTKYIQSAMNRSQYKILEDDGTFYGEIPELQCVWANADTLNACQAELQEVLEEWLLLSLHLHHSIPVLGRSFRTN